MDLAHQLNAFNNAWKGIGLLSDLHKGLAYDIDKFEIIFAKKTPAMVIHVTNRLAGNTLIPHPPKIYLPHRFVQALTIQEIEEYNQNPALHRVGIIYQGYYRNRHEFIFV